MPEAPETPADDTSPGADDTASPADPADGVGAVEAPLTRSERRRRAAERLADDAPREGVAIFRPVERAVLVGLVSDGRTAPEVDALLDELELLADTAGAEVVGRVTQRRSAPDAATFVGRGKVDELRGIARDLEADAIIVDDELSPAQQRTLEERLGVKVLDRTIVILDIFGQHAQSREGKAQVELAQLTYLLPRLRGWGQALSRQAGGIGPLRGPGETQLEVDRRSLNRRISKLRAELRDSRRTRALRAQRRERQDVTTVALVGYTNAGKSSLLNQLSGGEVLVADQLFATLDTTARRVELPDARTVVVTDTVGFVRKLPTQVVEAFRSTLEETLRADLMLHVVDGSHPEADEQIATVDRVLAEIGAESIDRLVVVNKADVAPPAAVEELRRRYDGSVVSARSGTGVDELRARIAAAIPPHRSFVRALVPWDRSDLVGLAYEDGEVLTSVSSPDGTYLEARVGPATRARFDGLEVDGPPAAAQGAATPPGLT